MIDVLKRHSELHHTFNRDEIVTIVAAEIEAEGRIKAAKAIGQSIEDAVKTIMEETKKRFGE